jgi:hypothetical protein
VNYPTTGSTDARFPCAFFGFWDYVLALGSGHKSAIERAAASSETKGLRASSQEGSFARSCDTLNVWVCVRIGIVVDRGERPLCAVKIATISCASSMTLRLALSRFETSFGSS